MCLSQCRRGGGDGGSSTGCGAGGVQDGAVRRSQKKCGGGRDAPRYLYRHRCVRFLCT